MLPEHDIIASNVAVALAEDIGGGDLTARLIPPDAIAEAHVVSRERAILCGSAWFEECFRQVGGDVHIEWLAVDGDELKPDQWICTLQGNARSLLTGERCALNFLQTLSGTATHTQMYGREVEGTKAVVMDTRKTLPGLRRAQKYAVTIGGGFNQRIGLYDGILIKENHIAAAGGIPQALQKAFKAGVPVQIEVESLDELDAALEAGARLILLDNFDIPLLEKAVAHNAGRAVLEASGGISLETLRAVAQTGVDRISVGSLTKDVKAIDFSMRFKS
ncbi:nicotinate-nucleotide pyrophosphorylase (carboxylating) [Novimethylophilus kurashikiensis]|uniref:Probable nicotinate-nucleotide pyrophosphorylase [carboxylating] n=1 Tax=Novimethylophilus kurashikiensis TaxID=1825523 RepID=A0A2R5FCB4_9PROT|nr:carboxylating nicotinate-nucleotide diphosphorylase [Novimethylophilus kurashikiensis]GBG15655.1 nicotinate-nucleotide pyrophosphorylase (carboxylating) [Novimethylophilus kurashikiensis]